jgi:hypothetical protein
MSCHPALSSHLRRSLRGERERELEGGDLLAFWHLRPCEKMGNGNGTLELEKKKAWGGKNSLEALGVVTNEGSGR